jgi:hypothetical protein
MTTIDGVSFEQTWATRAETMVAELSIHFISRELLIQNKRCAGRPKDLVDADELSSPG